MTGYYSAIKISEQSTRPSYPSGLRRFRLVKCSLAPLRLRKLKSVERWFENDPEGRVRVRGIRIVVDPRASAGGNRERTIGLGVALW